MSSIVIYLECGNVDVERYKNAYDKLYELIKKWDKYNEDKVRITQSSEFTGGKGDLFIEDIKTDKNGVWSKDSPRVCEILLSSLTDGFLKREDDYILKMKSELNKMGFTISYSFIRDISKIRVYQLILTPIPTDQP